MQQGQALGWPTANLRIPPERVTPPDGVYAARASYDGTHYDAIAYIGSRPTFGAGERLIEVNLLDHRDHLYGKSIAVEFIERLRGDHTFPSAQELAAQIARDVDRAKASLRRHEKPQGSGGSPPGERSARRPGDRSDLDAEFLADCPCLMAAKRCDFRALELQRIVRRIIGRDGSRLFCGISSR